MNVRRGVLGLMGVLAVAYEEGVRLGKVSDIYVDRKGCRITGIAISTGVPGFDSATHVDFKQVRILGKDVVIVASQKAATPLPAGIEETSLSRLRNVRIATRDGAYVGRLHDVSVDVSNGNIAQLMLSDRDYLDIAVRDTAIGSDIIVLPSNIRKKTAKAAAAPASTMSAESVVSMLDSATSRVLKAAKGTTEKVIETTKRTASNAREVMLQANGKKKSKSTSAARGKKAAATTRSTAAKKAARPAKKARRRSGLPKASQSRRKKG